MDADELNQNVRKRPFEAFRIHVSDGRVYEVTHPEQIMVGRRSSHLGLGDGEGPFQKIAVVSNIHITRIEPLDRKKRKGASKRRSDG